MNDWQPIESAPKDGTPILRWLKRARTPVAVKYVENPKGYLHGQPLHWQEPNHGIYWGERDFSPHWMECPAPPPTEGT